MDIKGQSPLVIMAIQFEKLWGVCWQLKYLGWGWGVKKIKFQGDV